MNILNKGKLTRKFEGGGDLIPIIDPRKIRATTSQPTWPPTN